MAVVDLQLPDKGLTYKQIAERLVLSHPTAPCRTRSRTPLNKLRLHNRVELVGYAIEQGLDEE